jgi:hypothetical protein
MKSTNLVTKAIRPALAAAAALAMAISAHAGLQIPYTPNADTMHLWHLDDASNQLYGVDAIASSTNGSTNAIPITLTNLAEPTPGTLPYTNANFGSPSFFPELNTSYSATTKVHLLYGGAFADVSQFRNPTSGAFTFEALVNLAAAASGADMEILAGDNGGAITARGWQWRIETGTIEWDLLAGGTDNDFKATIPTSGPDAFATNVWYHVAITYTGQSPTNTDTPNIITMYWTLVDGSRTNADVIGTYTATRPLDGSPTGASTPSLGIWGSARNTTSNPGNNEGGIGSIDEVRVTDLALKPYQMAFTNNGQAFPPTFLNEPPATTLAPYGGTLTINSTVSASLPTYTWLQYTTNSTNIIPNQSSSSLNISNITFASGGSYVLVVSNSINVVTSTVAVATIGASATGLYPTGLGTNGQINSDGPDANYTLIESQDANFLGPNAMVFEWNNPIEFAGTTGSYAPTNGNSIWIGDQGNPGGNLFNSVAGNYTYRTTFDLDQANPSNIVLSANFFCNGTATLLLNGQNTGFTISPGAALYFSSFTLSNVNNILYSTIAGQTFTSQSFVTTNPVGSSWFVPGLNTLDIVETITSGASAIYVQNPTSIGPALPPGLPTILVQPTNEIVRDANQTGSGSLAQFSVVATGRSPLTYQWFSGSSALSGQTNRLLDFYNPVSGGQGTNFTVVVSNASGAVTSKVAVLTVVPTNTPPVAPTVNVVSYAGAGATIEISDLITLIAYDPSGGQLYWDYADGSSTNGGSVNQVGEGLVYTPVQGYTGPDQFTYTVSDSLGATTNGDIDIQNLLSPTPSSQAVPPGIAVSYNVGVTNPPAGYKFQWQLNGVNIANATNGVLNLASVQSSNTGNYALIATDPSGIQWPSPTASLTVEGYPPYQVPVASIIDSSEQGGFPGTNAVDGLFTDYWVSYGTASGQQPTASSPEWLFVTFPRVVALSEVLVYPRSAYGPDACQLLVNCTLVPGTPPNGTETNGIPTNGTSIFNGTMANSATPLDVVLSAPKYVTNLELYVTSSYSADNVQVEEMVFNERALPGTFGDWELNHFTAAQLNTPATSSPFADPDGDGVINLQEFAVGGNPLVKDATNAAMTGVLLSGNLVGVKYQVTNNLGDISLQYQASPDLIHWTNVIPTAVNVITNRGTISIDEATFPQQATPQYFRLNYGLTNVLRY